MTLFQHFELFTIDLVSAALIISTAYSIMRLPWTHQEADHTWNELGTRLCRFFLLSKVEQQSPSSPAVGGSSSRRWIPIKVVQSC